MKEKQKHSVTPNVLPKSTPAEDNSLKESNTSSEGKEDKGYSGQEFIELYMSDNEVDKTPNVIPKTTPPDNIAQLIHKRKSANVRKPVRANNTAKSTGLKKSKKMLTTKPSNEKLSNKGVNDRNIFRAFVDSELAEITTKSATPSKEPKDIPRNSSKSYGVASFSDADLNLEGPMTLPSSSQQLIECSIYKSKPSRVGVIPSAGIKLSESYLNIPQPVTVLMRPEKRDYDLREERKRQKREHKRQKTTSHLKDISVFSGPRFSPGVYVIQATADDRRKNYVPDTGDIIDKESELNNVIARPSQYVKPDVSEYFKAALSDASRLPKYDEYNSRDPINFRHAYKAKSKSSHEPKVITKTAATILAADHEHTPPRRRHRKMIRDKSPEVVSDHESRKYNAMEIRNELLKDISDDDVEEVFDVDEDDKEEDVVFVQDSISELEHNDGHGHEYEDEDDRNTEHEQDDYMHDDQEDSIMIDDHHMSNQGLATTNLNLDGIVIDAEIS
ncbi:hypothetical protein BDB01DRAFT_221002 [Pilobolus umbonatus]|nr:hypothetical protein BDB01DRAFT_221002 [Pilobolus umbonatus]